MATMSSGSSVADRRDVLEQVGAVEQLLAGRLRRRPAVVRIGEQSLQQCRVRLVPGWRGCRRDRRPRPRRSPRCTAASIRAFAGPMSKASVGAPLPTTVMLAIPPRLSAPAISSDPPSSSSSSVLASGAPCPPAAMSRARTSATTGAPVASAIHAGWPSCRPPRARPSASTQWKIVWPWDTMRSTAPPPNSIDGRPCRLGERLADERVQPAHLLGRRRRRWQTAPRAARNVRRVRRAIAAPSGRSSIVSPTNRRSATATSMPSIDVPLIIPTTLIAASRAARTIAAVRRRGGRWPSPASTPVSSIDDRRLDVTARSVQRRRRGLRRSTRGGGDDSPGSIAQLDVGRPHVDHQVAERLAEADHRDRRDDVEHDLLRRAGLQPGRAGDDLRPGDELDRVVDVAAQLGVRIGRDADRQRADAACRGAPRRSCTASGPTRRCRRPRRRRRPRAPRDRRRRLRRRPRRLPGIARIGRRAAGHHADDAVGVERRQGTRRRRARPSGRRSRRRRRSAGRRGAAGRRWRRSPRRCASPFGDDGGDGQRLVLGHQRDEVGGAAQVEVGEVGPVLFGDEARQFRRGRSRVGPCPVSALASGSGRRRRADRRRGG